MASLVASGEKEMVESALGAGLSARLRIQFGALDGCARPCGAAWSEDWGRWSSLRVGGVGSRSGCGLAECWCAACDIVRSRGNPEVSSIAFEFRGCPDLDRRLHAA